MGSPVGQGGTQVNLQWKNKENNEFTCTVPKLSPNASSVIEKKVMEKLKPIFDQITKLINIRETKTNSEIKSLPSNTKPLNKITIPCEGDQEVIVSYNHEDILKVTDGLTNKDLNSKLSKLTEKQADFFNYIDHFIIKQLQKRHEVLLPIAVANGVDIALQVNNRAKYEEEIHNLLSVKALSIECFEELTTPKKSK